MEICALEYRPWKGKLRSGTFLFWPIARTGIGLVMRRWPFWIFLCIGLMNFFFHFFVVYMITVRLKLAVQGGPSLLLRMIPLEAIDSFGKAGRGYQNFLFSQSIVLMIMLGFAGSIVVGNDFRFHGVAFYLSKPVDRLQYFAGKFLSIFFIAALLTLIPAVLLFIEYGAFSESLDYYRDNANVFWGIVVYGTLTCTVTATVLLGVSSLLQKTIPTLVVWGGIFVFLPNIGGLLRRIYRGDGDPWGWDLINLWDTLRWTANIFFQTEEAKVSRYLERLPWTTGVLALWLAVSVSVFWWRIRRADAIG